MNIPETGQRCPTCKEVVADAPDGLRVEPVMWLRGMGKSWGLPPLSISQLKKNRKLITDTMDPEVRRDGGAFGMSDEFITGVTKIAHLALRRNYPDLKEEEVGDMISLREIQGVAAAVVTGRRVDEIPMGPPLAAPAPPQAQTPPAP